MTRVERIADGKEYKSITEAADDNYYSQSRVSQLIQEGRAFRKLPPLPVDQEAIRLRNRRYEARRYRKDRAKRLEQVRERRRAKG